MTSRKSPSKDTNELAISSECQKCLFVMETKRRPGALPVHGRIWLQCIPSLRNPLWRNTFRNLWLMEKRAATRSFSLVSWWSISARVPGVSDLTAEIAAKSDDMCGLRRYFLLCLSQRLRNSGRQLGSVSFWTVSEMQRGALSERAEGRAPCG